MTVNIDNLIHEIVGEIDSLVEYRMNKDYEGSSDARIRLNELLQKLTKEIKYVEPNRLPKST